MLLNTSQVCIGNSEEYFPLHEIFVGHHTLLYLEEEDGLPSEDVENLGRLSKLGGLLQPRELSNDYQRVTSYSSNLKWLQPGLQQ